MAVNGGLLLATFADLATSRYAKCVQDHDCIGSQDVLRTGHGR